MLSEFLARAAADETVYITDVRDAFQKEGTIPFSIHVTLYDLTKTAFGLKLPETKTEEEEAFVASYVNAMIYNILSSLGAITITIYTDTKNAAAMKLAGSLDETFQTALAKTDRSGYGKALNVNERILSVLLKGAYEFAFVVKDIEEQPAVEVKAKDETVDSVFAKLPGMVGDKMLLGIDIGGTDIKLTASVNGKLAVAKEYDWFPAGFARAEQFLEPVMQIVRLMRDAAALVSAGKSELVNALALTKDATAEEMQAGIEEMEKALAGEIRNFDAIGLSFPDVVIKNLIVGGETFKTKGMRENTELDYEMQFAKISVLADLLKEFVTEDGAVLNTNDGPMAAFTAAVEMAAVGEDVSKGFFAHTLGTELGTGWVKPDGSIPEIPLEVYNFIIDLGSFEQKKHPSADVRSNNNFNTNLPGTLQKYTCQYGVFRLAAKYLPLSEPEVFQAAFEQGIFVERDGLMVVPTEPKDMRKPALEYFMKQAASGNSPVCERIFREVGEFLAVTWQETDYILDPEAKDRSLFGRLVKVPECFDLMNEGAQARVPGLKQYAADGGMANTSLMKQLDAHPEYTVAQFAQAVGALYFGCVGLL